MCMCGYATRTHASSTETAPFAAYPRVRAPLSPRAPQPPTRTPAPPRAVVLCSDVVYEPAAYAPLLQTLLLLLLGPHAPEHAHAIIAHRSRHPDEHRFFRAAAAHFDTRVLLGGPFRPLGALPADPPIPAADEACGDDGARDGDGACSSSALYILLMKPL